MILMEALNKIVGLWTVKKGSKVLFTSCDTMETHLHVYELYRLCDVKQIMSDDKTTIVYVGGRYDDEG